MNAAQIKALIEWYKMLQGSAKGELLSQYGHLIPEETDIGIPSGIERGDIEAKRKFLEAQGRAERKGLREPPPVDLPPERTIQGQLESLEVPTVPGRELEVRAPQAPVTRYPGTLSGYTTPKTTVPSSYAIPERGIEAPDIHVDPSGQARIVSDYYDSIVNYRKSKTGMEPLGSRWEPERRLAATEQAIPDKSTITAAERMPWESPSPDVALKGMEAATAQQIEGGEAAKRRIDKLRAEQATKTSKFDELVKRYRRAAGKRYRELKRGRGRGGLPFNPKIWDRSLIPAGGPTDAFKRMMDRRSR